jgi:hypothetical protein
MRRRWTRRDFLKAVAATVAGGVSSTHATDRAVRAERLSLDLPGLDPAHDGLRVAQLSDIHVGALTAPELIRESIGIANAFRPDLTVLTGDFLSREDSGVGLLREQLAGIASPTVAVLGNHDHAVDAEGATAVLASLGYAVLRNENTTLYARGAPLKVVGIDDHCTGHADPRRAMRGVGVSSRLVLAHDPTTADLLRDAPAPLLVLSGHTHGGQVNLPLGPGQRMPYLSGLFRVGQVLLYVNRGVGNTWLPIRVNAPPEVALFTLHSPTGGPTGREPEVRIG